MQYDRDLDFFYSDNVCKTPTTVPFCKAFEPNFWKFGTFWFFQAFLYKQNMLTKTRSSSLILNVGTKDIFQ